MLDIAAVLHAYVDMHNQEKKLKPSVTTSMCFPQFVPCKP